MPIKSKRVNLSILPSKIKYILDIGRQNRLQEINGSLPLTSICTKIIYFVIDLHTNQAIQTFLRKEGGSLFDLITRAITIYITEQDKGVSRFE